MAAVFDRYMDPLGQDQEQSFARLESFIRYMQERIEFSNRNMTRLVSEAGASSVEIWLAVRQLQGDVAAYGTAISNLSSQLNALAGRTGQAEGDIQALQMAVTGLQSSVTQLGQSLAELGADLRADLAALEAESQGHDARITALENAGADTYTDEVTGTVYRWGVENGTAALVTVSEPEPEPEPDPGPEQEQEE